MVILLISVHIDFDALLGFVSSDCNYLVIGCFCLLKFSNSCFLNTVISEMLFGNVKTSHYCNLFLVDTHWLNGVSDITLRLGEGLHVALSEFLQICLSVLYLLNPFTHIPVDLAVFTLRFFTLQSLSQQSR